MLCLLAYAPKVTPPQRKRMPSRIPSELRVLRALLTRDVLSRRAFAADRKPLPELDRLRSFRLATQSALVNERGIRGFVFSWRTIHE